MQTTNLLKDSYKNVWKYFSALDTHFETNEGVFQSVVGESHVLQMHNSLPNKFGDFSMRILSEFYIENGANAKFAKQSSWFFERCETGGANMKKQKQIKAN